MEYRENLTISNFSQEIQDFIKNNILSQSCNNTLAFNVIKEFFGEDNVDYINHIIDNIYSYFKYKEGLEGIKGKEIISRFPNVSLEEFMLTYYISSSYKEKDDILIFFPELEIKNKYNEHHIIKELYVKLNLTDENFNISGIRTKATVDEINTHYLHSHLPGQLYNNNLKFSNFCLGRGPLISDVSFILENRSNATEGMWVAFCKDLDDYVRWESIDGGPYIKMSSIAKSITTIQFFIKDSYYVKNHNYNEYDWICNDLADYIIKNKVLNYSVFNNLITFRDTDRMSNILLSDFVIKYLNSIAISATSYFFFKELFCKCIINNNGEILLSGKMPSAEEILLNEPSAININYDIITNPVLVFKGEPKYLTVENSPIQSTFIYLLTPYYYNKIKDIILNKINIKYATNTKGNRIS